MQRALTHGATVDATTNCTMTITMGCMSRRTTGVTRASPLLLANLAP